MPRKSILTATFASALVLLFAPWSRSQQPGILAVEGATLIDGTGAVPIPKSVIVIENGKISAVGARGKVQVPAGARTVDAKGKFVIPRPAV